MKKTIFIIIFIIFIILLFILIDTNLFLILETNNKKMILKVNNNDEFIISYKHSVALSKVYEYYKILNNKIILYEMDFSDQCAGLPTEVFDEEKFIMSEDKFKIINMNREFKTINYRINKNLDFKLIINNMEYNLSEIFGTTLVVISIRRSLCLMKI